MSKNFYVLFLLATAYCTSLNAQMPPIIANTYNNVFLGNWSVSGGNCAPDPDFNITLGQDMVPFLNGVDIVAVVTNLTQPQPNSIQSSYGPMAVGDTLPFDTTLAYPVWMWAGGTIEFEYRAVGIPMETGEKYPCDLTVVATLAWCNNNVFLDDVYSNDSCEVLPFNSVTDGAGMGWELYPIPSHGPLRLSHKDGQTQWEMADLYDLQGRQLRHWEAEDELSTAGLKTGVYFLKFQALGEESVMRVLVE